VPPPEWGAESGGCPLCARRPALVAAAARLTPGLFFSRLIGCGSSSLQPAGSSRTYFPCSPHGGTGVRACGREPPNSTGGTCTHMRVSCTGCCAAIKVGQRVSPVRAQRRKWESGKVRGERVSGDRQFKNHASRITFHVSRSTFHESRFTFQRF